MQVSVTVVMNDHATSSACRAVVARGFPPELFPKAVATENQPMFVGSLSDPRISGMTDGLVPVADSVALGGRTGALELIQFCGAEPSCGMNAAVHCLDGARCDLAETLRLTDFGDVLKPE